MKRRTGHRKPGRRLLLICEGAVAEPTYLRSARSHFQLPRVNVEIRSCHGGSPRSIVDTAIKEKRKRQSREAAFDEVWAIFDAEDASTSGVREAVEAGLRAGISIAVSNPSFETWLLLHAATRDRASTAGDAKAACEREMSIPGRRGPAAFNDSRLVGTHVDASANARAGRARAADVSGLPPEPTGFVVAAGNPSTTIDELIDALGRARPS